MGDRMDHSGAGSSKAVDATVAQKNWQLCNKIETIDTMFDYDEKEQMTIRNAKPWDKDPHYFKEVKISAVALLKMTMHARRGGNLEVMGLMQGRVDAHTLVVVDAFALPVEGTETRVNAQAQAYEYMTMYTELCEPIGRKDKVVGWYHSHPGYGCWLSGIDVQTQAMNQQFQEPWLAVVIDPMRTISAGKVEIGAFRTYPKGYQPPEEAASEYQSIPLDKIADFGVHCKQYYALDVSYFKSSLDAAMLDSLWSTYWQDTLSSSPLLQNAGYMNNQLNDLAGKLKQVEGKWNRGERASDASEHLDKATRDAATVGGEVLNGLITQQMKNALFNHKCNCRHEQQAAVAVVEADMAVDGAAAQ